MAEGCIINVDGQDTQDSRCRLSFERVHPYLCEFVFFVIRGIRKSAPDCRPNWLLVQEPLLLLILCILCIDVKY